jgi:hypothetical protein
MIDAFDVLKITSLNSIASTSYAAKSLVQQAITELKKTDGTHLYLPGVSSTFGVSTGNYIDSAGTQVVVMDSPVGLVVDATGIINASQSTTANKPVLRRGAVNFVRYSGDFANASWSNLNMDISQEEGPTGLIDATRLSANASVTLLAQSAIVASNTVMTACLILKVTGINLVIPVLLRNGTTSTSFEFGYFNCATGNITGAGWSSTALVSNNSWRIVTFTQSSGITVGDSLVIYAGATGNSSNVGDYYILYRTAVFAGAYTATQIQALGGIPLTATVPVSTTLGSSRWDFDSTDSLQLTFPAGYGSATIIDATAAGQVTLTGQNITGAYNIGPSLSTNGRIILRDTPTQRQLYLYQTLAKRLAGL